MKIFQELLERGLPAQFTNNAELETMLNNGGERIYIGFDATAKSLHVGHLLQLIVLKRLQKAGHIPILLLGGGTTMVGDPSGRSDMRQMLDNDDIAKNNECFKRQFERFIDFSEGKALIVNNADWLLNQSYLPFLCDIGAHFSINQMLSAECYKQRMEKGLSYLELSYQVMQAFDFLVLNDKYSCRLQLGGNDQWSNILAGVDLVRKKRKKTVYGMTFNLLTTSEGAKMGKTQKGTIWLDAEMTSPYELFQYFRNVDDKDVVKCLKFLTFLPLGEIREMERWSCERINETKKILAYEVTKLVHGEAIAQNVLVSSEQIFSGRGENNGMPTTEIEVDKSLNIIDILLAIKFVPTKSEGRRMIQGGGIYMNDRRVDDFDLMINPADFLSDDIIIRKGKKYYHKVKLIPTVFDFKKQSEYKQQKVVATL